MKLIQVIAEHSETFAGELGCEHCPYTETVQDLPKAQEWRLNTLPTKYCPSCQRNRSGQINPEITSLLEQQRQASASQLGQQPAQDDITTADGDDPLAPPAPSLDPVADANAEGSGSPDNIWP